MKNALRLQALLFCRPGELRQMRWEDVRLDDAQWDYSPSKGGKPMIVPLPRQARAILDEQLSLRRADSPWVFSG